MEDEMKELNRIWESLEFRLASFAGNQERGYSVTRKSPVQLNGFFKIPTNATSEEIIEIINNETNIFVDDNPDDYDTLGDGSDQSIQVYRKDDPELKTVIEISTNDDIEDFDQFMGDILDIERTQCLSGRDGWTTREYTIVTGTGGPHVEFTTGYSLHVYWGGKQIEMTTYNDSARATIDRIEEYLNEIYQE